MHTQYLILCFLSLVKFKLKSYFAERKGERDEMQDAHITFDSFTDEINDLDHSVYVFISFK